MNDHATNRSSGQDVASMRVTRGLEDLAGCAGGTLVPTMGALHEGHMALLRRARMVGAPVVVSVFVNPTQFGPREDFDHYPRTLDADLERCRREGVDVVFCPSVEIMYPPGETVPVPPLPAVATRAGLEDRVRPGHFDGVCQVVARLFDLVRPAVAVFGEKDYQQLLVIRAMVAASHGRWGDLVIEGHPTLREADGLAMSSRNRNLPADDRDCALGIVRALKAARQAWAAQPEAAAAQRTMTTILADHRLEVDYAVVRDAETLEPPAEGDRPVRALVAARLGAVRLIDNMLME